MIIDVVKVLLPSAIAFAIGILGTPILTHYLYKYKCWKKKVRADGLAGFKNSVAPTLASQQQEIEVPRMGGIVIWASVALTTFAFWAIAHFSTGEVAEKLNFFSRNQTWLPLFTLIAASGIGLFDDFLAVFGGGKYVGGGLSLRARIALVLLIGLAGGWWFFFKLGVSTIAVPFVGELELGILLIPFFMAVMLALFSGGVIDGIDGLSGGVFASIFTAYAGIAFFQDQINLAAFCAVIVGGILAFLWFNIPPARFYMGETGILGLTTTLAVVAFLTKAVVVLPIIAFLPLAAAGSDIIQLASKKLRGGKKVFRVAPIHHHFEALGWPPEKVTMRFWVLGMMFATIGMVIALIG